MDDKQKQLYFHYLEKDVWYEQEVICILHGIFPESKNRYANFKRLENLGINFRETKQALDDALFVGLLARDKFPQEGMPNIDYDEESQDYIYSSKEVMEWAKDKKNTYPNFPYHYTEITNADASGANGNMPTEIALLENCQLNGVDKEMSELGIRTGEWQLAAYKKALELNYPEEGKQANVAFDLSKYLDENKIFKKGGKPVDPQTITKQVLTPLNKKNR